MIIVTVTYPAYNDKPEYSKDFIFENVPAPNTVKWLNDKREAGRITRVVVSNGDSVLWDTDRTEDWF